MFTVGQKVDNRYEVKGLLDATTTHRRMGTVYRAFDSVFRIERAIKTINEKYQNDEELKERFRREALTPARIGHPGIITVLDFVEAHDHVPTYMVMELLTDYDRMDKVISDSPLETAETVQLMSVISSALGAAHRRRIVHRDVKSTNIFARKTDGGWCAKVIDFGIAKIPNEEEGGDDTDITDIGKRVRMGTYSYMAPEQFSNYSIVDCRADVYSLGVLSYELLSGGRLFAGADANNYENQHLKPITFPESVCIPAEVKTCVLNSLSRNPNERPQDAEAFAAQLKLALEEEVKRQQEHAKKADKQKTQQLKTELEQLRVNFEEEKREAAEARRLQKESENEVAIAQAAEQRTKNELARLRKTAQTGNGLSRREKQMLGGMGILFLFFLIISGLMGSELTLERDERTKLEKQAAGLIETSRAAEAQTKQATEKVQALERTFKDYRLGKGDNLGIAFHGGDVFVSYDENILTFRYASPGRYVIRITTTQDTECSCPSWTEDIPTSPGDKYYVVRRMVQKAVPNEFKLWINEPQKSETRWESYVFTKPSGS